MMPQEPLISIIIVNYNSGTYLPRCLDSLREQTWQDFEVIVIDNASTDHSMACLDAYPWVRRVYNSTNRGFAAAQNQGIALAQGRYILALNFDVVMTPSFLERLVTAIKSHPQIGWGCGKLLNMNPDGTLTNTIYATGHLLPPNRFPLLRGNGELDQGQYNQLEYVFGAPGAAALYKQEMVKDISFNGQFFDETFFTWCEDVDVDWRAQNRGWKCLYVPDAVAYHRGHVGEEYREPFRSFRAKLTIRNRWLMILANQRKQDLDIPALARYELSLLIFVTRTKMTWAYIGAIASFISLIPTARQKRMLIQD